MIQLKSLPHHSEKVSMPLTNFLNLFTVTLPLISSQKAVITLLTLPLSPPKTGERDGGEGLDYFFIWE